MELTGIASQTAKPLEFALMWGPGHCGQQAVSRDFTRIYHVINEGTGVSDGYGLRVNSMWLPYRGYLAEMVALANAIEAQNDETGIPD